MEERLNPTIQIRSFPTRKLSRKPKLA